MKGNALSLGKPLYAEWQLYCFSAASCNVRRTQAGSVFCWLSFAALRNAFISLGLIRPGRTFPDKAGSFRVFFCSVISSSAHSSLYLVDNQASVRQRTQRTYATSVFRCQFSSGLNQAASTIGSCTVTPPIGGSSVCVGAEIQFSVCCISTLMITLQIDKLLGDRSHYWLAKSAGIAHSTIQELSGPNSEGIKYATLDKLCEALECEPGDLLVRVAGKLRKH